MYVSLPGILCDISLYALVFLTYNCGRAYVMTQVHIFVSTYLRVQYLAKYVRKSFYRAAVYTAISLF